MPELLHLVDRKLEKAQMLLKSLLIIGVILGLALGIVGTCVPWLLPKIFTSYLMVIQQAGRELKFLSLSMSGCFSLGALLLLLVSSKGFGLPGYWCALVGFQWARFFLSLSRLISPNGVLYAEDSSLYELGKLKAV